MTTGSEPKVREDAIVSTFLRHAKDMTAVLLDGAEDATLNAVRDAVVKGVSTVLEVVYQPGGVPQVQLLLQDENGERLVITHVEFVAAECAVTAH